MTSFKYDFNFTMHLGATSIVVKIQSHSKAVALRAPSGSGKSSFVRIITGLHKKVSGEKFTLPKRIGYVPQDSCLIPHMTVRKNLLLSPFAVKNELEKICTELSIAHLLDRYPRMLSGGEKQRVSIGRALLSNPELLILDEPFAALDYEIRQKIAEFLKQWIETRQMDLILVTHDESSSNSLCDETWTIRNGSLYH